MFFSSSLFPILRINPVGCETNHVSQNQYYCSDEFEGGAVLEIRAASADSISVGYLNRKHSYNRER